MSIFLDQPDKASQYSEKTLFLPPSQNLLEFEAPKMTF